MTRSRYRIVVEVEAVVDLGGTRETFLFGYEDWCTAPTDTPANTPVRGLLASAGRFSRNLFQGGGVTGRIVADYGYARLRNPRPAELAGAGELDDWFGYSVSGCSYVVRRGLVGAAYPAGYTVLFTAQGLNMPAGDDITLRLQDGGALLDQPIVAEGFAGTGGLEGTGSVGGRKQFVSETPGFFPPVLVDADKGIYYVQSTSTQGLHDSYLTSSSLVKLFDVYVDGVEQTRAANYTGSAELLSTAPAAGEVRYWFGPDSTQVTGWKDGPVYFRLGTLATGEVRVFAVGGPTDADHIRRGTPLGSFRASHLALRAGVPLTRIDTSADGLTVEAQLVDDGERTYADVLSDAALARQGWFGFDRLGNFVSGYLLDPADDDIYYGVDPAVFGGGARPPVPTTSLWTFTSAQVLARSVRRMPVQGLEAPVSSFSVDSGDCWPCTVSPDAHRTLRDYLTREVWTAISGTAAATKVADPGAGHMSVTTRGRYLPNTFSQRLMLERLAVLYAGRRFMYQWTVLIDDELPADVIELELHDVVTLEFDHLGLSAGVKVRIVSIEIDLTAPQHKIVFTGWGGTKGQLTPPTGGGGGDDGGGSSAGAVAAAVAQLGDFTGVMYGAVTTGGTSGSAGSADAIADFDGYIVGSVIDDAYFGDVVLLMHCDTESPAWVDSSMLAATLTESGTITASTSSPLVGTASMVPGASGKVNTPTALVYNMGSGDLTVECTVVLTATPSSERLFEIGGTGIQIWFNGSTTSPTVLAFGGTVFTASALSTSTTYHLALVKSGTSYTLYANGTSIGSGTRAGSDDGTTNRTIAVGNQDSAGQPAVSCKLDEIRVTKGVARYTGSFTPPSTPYPGL